MPKISKKIAPVDFKIEIQLPYDLSEHEMDAVYNGIEEVCGSLAFTHTQFTLELPVELLEEEGAIKKKLDAIYKEIDAILERTKKEDRESFTAMAAKIEEINEDAKDDGDVLQIVEYNYLPEHIRVDLDEQDTAIVYVDNEERTPLGRITVNEGHNKVLEIQASF